jgi:preprotein translocase subunit SecA
MYARRRKLLLGSREEVKEYFDGILAGAGEFGTEATVAREEKIAIIGADAFYDVIRRLALQTNDMFWIDHLELMDYARSSVNLRAYGQRDPLVEYKKEGVRLFKDMQESVNAHILQLLPAIGVGAFAREEQALKKAQERAVEVGGEGATTVAKASRPIRNSSGEKIGRNDPCFCGSGKKYKRCHGA